ncbi:EpsI family protein [Methyloversatilis sp. RAC08]|uniref:exosortase-associated protein EpsI, B-type n=1 Tax=Methyloversatilis sp. RAC08 TaxID=1842540 RepID=UPI00083D1178|nr:exosortase-associated protein EpsI, B-type [Methyloversatilis sp. RAC08]AOF83584.1 EpsI family protein [Methyloversatilis sp. RAC08]
MRKNLIMAVVATALMSSAAALAYVLKPDLRAATTVRLEKLEDIVPKQFGDWKLNERASGGLVNPQTEEILNSLYDEILTRTYVNQKGQYVMLSLAFGADQSKATQIHRPEVCYPAQGFQIKKAEKSELLLNEKSIPVMKLVAVAGSRVEPIIYWIVVGDQVVRGWFEQKMAAIDYGVRGLIPYGLLFRVSTIGPDSDKQFEVQQEFLTSLQSAVDEENQTRLFGNKNGL